MLETGKLDSELLKQIVFNKIKYRSEDVKVRPGIGEDCAVMDFGDYECIMSTDPITAAVSDIGRLAIHITCNDIASNGVQPLGIMLAVMLPVGTTEEDIEAEYENLSKQYELEIEKIKEMVPMNELTESLKVRKATKLIVDSAVAVAPKAE